jgi:hypothetical protein
VSHAGLVPLLELAEQTGLGEIIAGKVSITTPRIKSGAANPLLAASGLAAAVALPARPTTHQRWRSAACDLALRTFGTALPGGIAVGITVGGPLGLGTSRSPSP